MSGFDRGMEDAYYGFGPSSRGGHDYMDGYAYGSSLIEQEYYAAAERAHYEQLAAEYYAEQQAEYERELMDLEQLARLQNYGGCSD